MSDLTYFLLMLPLFISIGYMVWYFGRELYDGMDTFLSYSFAFFGVLWFVGFSTLEHGIYLQIITVISTIITTTLNVKTIYWVERRVLPSAFFFSFNQFLILFIYFSFWTDMWKVQ